ncbi:insulin-like growth factor-binding protein-related protein 1 [Nasonia vitripennis]|uniref:Kazal-type serine protease inhibitor domain-containing protein 1 n=1 Tax=Nasonia vitripennis TaxID=7425 RepID=A0A7M7QI47_NASVI|nr:insulin-like growth factor-binding protein-related protein 1 [Nasonia vitripennis]
MSSPAMIFLVLLLACAVNARTTMMTTTLRPVPDYYEPDEEDLSTTEAAYAEGCYVCGDYRCPSDPGECLLGAVPDTCGCCNHQGVCARLDGEPCWNASIPELPKERRNEGLCARNYVCQLRTDLESEDTPEAVCVCMEQSPACGSNNRTYATPCALHEEAVRHKSPEPLKLLHLGPCPSRPKIYSAPEDVTAEIGHYVALNCEVKGFPLPDIFWEFHAADGSRVLRFPNDELEEAYVNTSEGDSLMRSSWLQLARLQHQHLGTYHCIANNSVGQASAASIVAIE